MIQILARTRMSIYTVRSKFGSFFLFMGLTNLSCKHCQNKVTTKTIKGNGSLLYLGLPMNKFVYSINRHYQKHAMPQGWPVARFFSFRGVFENKFWPQAALFYLLIISAQAEIFFRVKFCHYLVYRAKIGSFLIILVYFFNSICLF